MGAALREMGAEVTAWRREGKNRWKFWCGIALALLTLFLFYGYIYNDILETARMGIAFWEDLFSGRIRYFYDGYVHMNPVAYTKDVRGVYDFPIYLLFAVWNFPLYLLQTFAGIDVFTSPLALMWMKTLLLVFVVLTTAALYRLCRTVSLTKRVSLGVCLLFVTSNFFMTSIVMMSAYDIVPLFFAILGVRYYLLEEHKKFVLMFMLAVPLKFFSLLLFLPLLLLRQKNIWKILGNVILVALPIFVFRILIPCTGNGAGFRLLDALKGTELSNLALLYAITYYVELALGQVYFSVLGFGVLLAACYFVRLKTREEYCRYGIYVCFVSYAILFVTCYSHPYWLFILTPFMMMVIGQNRQYLHINLILETLATWGMLLAQLFAFPWCFGNALACGTFWPLLLGQKAEFAQYNLSTILTGAVGEESVRKLSTGAAGMGSSVFIACIVMMAVLNFPVIADRDWPLLRRGERAEGWIMPFRLLAGVAVGLLPVVMYALYVRG